MLALLRRLFAGFTPVEAPVSIWQANRAVVLDGLPPGRAASPCSALAFAFAFVAGRLGMSETA
ncbi:hypothetical protein [Comamonas sp. 17RB]|uniref:hypothetical protein n=1 Tax=Comamonas sp. 17RB TaxID=3047025 RepID=UPI0024B7954C|nr:hypothetical protein [Comamonas sp. 17RB]MDI9854870.1 hypothetical protein [Comamonas sp. 17RB]